VKEFSELVYKKLYICQSYDKKSNVLFFEVHCTEYSTACTLVSLSDVALCL